MLRRSGFRHIWSRALKSAGLTGVRFHDLRHTGSTLAALQAGRLVLSCSFGAT
jgi:integrase